MYAWSVAPFALPHNCGRHRVKADILGKPVKVALPGLSRPHS
jgi:hypothetical protein